jgi:cytochrome c551/c552
MPAAEQTWRSQKRLHLVFGISSVLLLLATLWMFQADHQREWKQVQRVARNIDIQTTRWRKEAIEFEIARQTENKLQQELHSSKRKKFSEGQLERFQSLASGREEISESGRASFTQAVAAHGQATAEAVPEAREGVLAAIDEVIKEVRFHEDKLLTERKAKRADLDEAKANYGLAIRDGRSRQRLAELSSKADKEKQQVDSLSRDYERVNTLRIELKEIRAQLTRQQDEAQKQVDDAEVALKQLESAILERHSGWVEGKWLGKRWLELPILDAFGSPLKIVNNWSDDLEQDYSHARVRRFDRCATCHQMMEKTLPGSAVDAAFMKERLLTLILVPNSSSSDEAAEGGLARQLFDQLGLMLASEGLLERNDVTISYVRASSPGAEAAVAVEQLEQTFGGEQVMLALLKAASDASPIRPNDLARDARPGLEAGDVIVKINGDPVVEESRRVAARLLTLARGGKPLELVVKRGMPNPFTTHPRLDLFVGSLSPHMLSDFACTICHDGQGSATAFRWSSHTPDTPEDRTQWVRDHNWFDNAHWIYPMYSKRFTEATCLKCHHDLNQLAVSERFPDPPAPKLMKGYNLIRKYGCYGCHEINGFDGPNKRVGPDMRLEPNFFAVAQQLQAEAGFAKLSDSDRELVRLLVDHPEDTAVRHKLAALLKADASEETTEPTFSADVHDRLTALLGDVTSPGTQRRPGPSLRYLHNKVEPAFLSDWIRQPSHFRPGTRMPQFFGLWDHLPSEGSGDEAERYEPLEVYAISHFLLSTSRNQPFGHVAPPSGITEQADVGRGEILFQERGCLACHSHDKFKDIEGFRPTGEIVQGPDLSNLAAKFGSLTGRRWLYSWIREPTRYHARTVMPNLMLEKISHRDSDGKVTSVTDPAADLVAYLVSTGDGGWSPAEGTISELTGQQHEQLDRLALEHLQGAYYLVQAKDYLKRGIPDRPDEKLKGAEVELLVPQGDYDANQDLLLDKKLRYVGRRSIAKYGCYGCHDIPGFEQAKTIGTALADWGRKETSKLAFEHVLEYLGLGHHEVHDADAHEGNKIPEFFEQQLQSHNRIGFLYQKLREPRGYDFEKTGEKGYNERLRMPRFPFSHEEREEVMTFVLGLVSDPPRAKYIYQPDSRTAALQQGERVLQKYNCRGCHMLTPEILDVAFGISETDEENDSASFLPTAGSPSFSFTEQYFSQAQRAESTVPDFRNQLHATLVGMPALADNGHVGVYSKGIDDNLLPEDEDIALSDLTQIPFQLWKPALVGGTVYQAGSVIPTLNPALVTRRQVADGGVLARYLLPHVTRREKQIIPNAKGTESWAWVPPPLFGEGLKVQTQWLHDFLLDPYPIRPAVVLRMPRFNMSSEEATALVNYFAARDDVDYPYTYNQQRDQELLEAREIRYLAKLADPAGRAEQLMNEGARLHDAMQIITSPDYCIKCHIVGDFAPTGADRGKAPDLARVFERLRPGYMRSWIAKPTGTLPYTSMPVNVPFKPEDTDFQGGVDQQLYHGTSTDQIDALVDLLMNYDTYAKRRASIVPLVEAAAAAAKLNAPTDPADPAADSEDSDDVQNSP